MPFNSLELSASQSPTAYRCVTTAFSLFNKSLTNLGPSATNTRSLSLYFFWPKLWIYLTCDLEIMHRRLNELCYSNPRMPAYLKIIVALFIVVFFASCKSWDFHTFPFTHVKKFPRNKPFVYETNIKLFG